MKRREFLSKTTMVAAAAGLGPVVVGAAATPARALGPGQRVRMLQLRYDGNWRPHERGTAALVEELKHRTTIDVAGDPIGMRADDPRIARQAFALLGGDREFRFSGPERESLKRWIELGGFLLVDNAGQGRPDKGFDESVRRELDAMFPRRRLERLSPEHVVYRSFYRLDYPAGRALHKPYVEGLLLGRRVAVVVNHNDLFGAYARDAVGRYLYTPSPGGENQREMAVRFGINLLMYGMCLHYKDDQVHLDYLLHKRKWKIHAPR